MYSKPFIATMCETARFVELPPTLLCLSRMSQYEGLLVAEFAKNFDFFGNGGQSFALFRLNSVGSRLVLGFPPALRG